MQVPPTTMYYNLWQVPLKTKLARSSLVSAGSGEYARVKSSLLAIEVVHTKRHINESYSYVNTFLTGKLIYRNI
jgi:hypothetical protein